MQGSGLDRRMISCRLDTPCRRQQRPACPGLLRIGLPGTACILKGHGYPSRSSTSLWRKAGRWRRRWSQIPGRRGPARTRHRSRIPFWLDAILEGMPGSWRSRGSPRTGPMRKGGRWRSRCLASRSQASRLGTPAGWSRPYNSRKSQPGTADTLSFRGSPDTVRHGMHHNQWLPVIPAKLLGYTRYKQLPRRGACSFQWSTGHS